MLIRNLGICVLLLALVGCATTPKPTYVDSHDPIMDRNGGVLVMVDACITMDVVGDEDHIVIAESQEGANALTKEISTYLEQHGVQVKSELVPFVCGAIQNSDNPPQKYADERGGQVNESMLPLAVAEDLKTDDEYVKALAALSTNVFQMSMNKMAADNALKNKKPLPEASPQIVSAKEFQAAVDVIQSKTGASSLLYLGVKGTSISKGKAIGQGLFGFTVAMATGIATAGLGAPVAVYLIPPRQVDWRYLSSGLVDLESAKTIWHNWGSAGGDPLKPEIIANNNVLNLVMRELVSKQETTAATAAR